MKLARDVSYNVLPAGAPRHLLLVIATYANEYGNTFVGAPALAHGMGYRWQIDAAGNLTGSARSSFERTFSKLCKSGLVARVRCDCGLHQWHFQLDVLKLASGRMATPRVAKRQHGQAFRDGRMATRAMAKQPQGPIAKQPHITPVVTNTTEPQLLPNTSLNHSQSPSGPVNHRLASESMDKSGFARSIDSDTTAAADAGDQHGHDDDLTDITHE